MDAAPHTLVFSDIHLTTAEPVDPERALWKRYKHHDLGFVVELGGRRVLHVGDANFSDDVLSPFRLDTARIDVALLPTWVITSDDGRRLIERWIRPKQVVAIHVGEEGGDRASREVQAAFPGAMTFTRSHPPPFATASC